MKKNIRLLASVSFCIVTLASSLLLFTNLSFIKTSAYQVLYGYTANETENSGIKSRLVSVAKEIDIAVTDYIGFKNRYIEAYGFIQKLIGSKYVNTGNRKLVRLDSGAIFEYLIANTDSTAVCNAQKITFLKETLEQRSIPLIFTVAPCKADKYNNELPYNMTDFSNSAGDAFVTELRNSSVNVFDLREWFHSVGLKNSDCFFVSDNHWKPEYGLRAWQAVTKRLNDDYGFGLDTSLFDSEKYNYKTYENNYLGSTGRVIGKSYSGLDDITLITPKFDTLLSLTNERLGYDKHGTFEEVTINTDALVFNDYYNSSPLNLYYSRDSHIKNELSSNDLKVLFVRDSFGGMIGGFVSLTFNETEIVDMRTIGEKKLMDVVDGFNPDIVIFMYNISMLSDRTMFDF